MRNALGWWWHTPEDLLDKVDEANLMRDTRVFVRALWRLLTDAVLPLDTGAQAISLVGELAKLEASLQGRLSVAPLVAAAEGLREAASALAGPPEAINRALMAASRALVPMDYTFGDRFVHDPALPQNPWPALDPIRALARVGVDPDAIGFARVDAVRARNRVLHALHTATSALAAA
jgi:hypothetical protein